MKIETFVIDKTMAEKFYPLLTEDARQLLDESDTYLIGAAADRRAAGAALLSIDEKESMSSQILYLAVADECRRKGVGTALLDRCLRASRQFAVSSMDCVIFNPEDGDETQVQVLDAFLTSWGMRKEDEEEGAYGSFNLGMLKETGVLFRAFGSDRESLMRFKKEDASYCIPLSKADESVTASCDHKLMAPCGFENLEQDLSQVFVKDGKLLASFLVKKLDDELYIEWMSAGKDNRLDALIFLMDNSMKAALEKYPEDTRILYSAWDESAKKLITRILGEDRKEDSMRYYSISDMDFRLKEAQ